MRPAHYASFLNRSPRAPESWVEAIGVMARIGLFLENELDTHHGGQVGLITKPESGQEPASAEQQLRRLLDADPQAHWLRYDIFSDDMGMQWVVVRGPSLESLTRDTQTVGRALEGHGFERRIVGVVFPFTWQKRRQYWIYQYRIGRFTPFAPTGEPEQHLRDTDLEVRMEKALRKHLPTDKHSSEWHPVWWMPF